MRLGALFYDVGKLRVPLGTLDKSGPLTSREYEFVRTHTVLGEELVSRVRFPWDIRPIIRSHHERLDGAGYPDGLRGDAIPVAAQIVGLLDVYRALLSPRPGRPAMTHAEALREVEQCRSRWRPEVYAAFRQWSSPEQARCNSPIDGNPHELDAELRQAPPLPKILLPHHQ
jgi:HD-GYP domain-containing protein (c-di-GMP phosphodiesterase class II)